MKETGKVIIRTLVLAVILLVGVVTAIQALAQNQSEDDRYPRGRRWQAMALTQTLGKMSNSELATKINKAGRDGWELVSVEGIMESGTTTQIVYYFKKPFL